MVSVAVPLLVMVTVLVGDGLPISTTENARLVGLKETLGPEDALFMIETLFELLFATARSRYPSLLKSPTAAA